MKKVSVIIPCYNGGVLLERAVNSVINQTCHEYEIIIVNDGSNDDRTLKVLKNLSAEVRVINQENKGLSGARNTGILNADSKYILTLDCDDYLEPVFLEKAIGILERQEELAYVFTHIKMFGDKQGVLNRKFNYFVQLFTNQLPYCLLMHKELWEKIGGYDENMKLGYEDWEFNIRLGKAGYYGIELEEPLFNYFVSSSGMMKSTSDKNYIAILRYIRKKHSELYSLNKLYKIWRDWNKQYMPYPTAIYILMYVFTEFLPGNIYNYLYKRLSFLKQSERHSA